VGELTFPFDFVSLRTAKSIIANCLLGDIEEDAQLGSISLREHQQSAVTRIQSAIKEFGGAVLCDPAGTGKTFTALACIPTGQTALVVGPAVLREMWVSAASRGERDVHFCSYEALSRRKAPERVFDFVILDEAHHARNPLTIRYRLLSDAIHNSPTLMLTATPVHNRLADLLALLRLVMGDRSRRLSASELSRCVIRRDALTDSLPIPRKRDLVWHEVHDHNEIAQRILALPPALPPSDGDDGGVLIVHSLMRQWASSDAALRGALRRRVVQAAALEAALEDGTLPTRRELASWITGNDAVQLSFAGFLAEPAGERAGLLDVVKAHRDGIVGLLSALDAAPSSDRERADIIEQIMLRHAGEKIVAFSAYANTVDAMFKRLSRRGRVAALTGSGARVAGGRISRADAIRQFAPLCDIHHVTPQAEEIQLLLTTDLLSEGVDLQNASVVIHLDLPWTPARLEQRTGRLARIGSVHSHVAAHAFRPRASAELNVHIEEILHCKAIAVTGESDSRAHAEELRAILAGWKSTDSTGSKLAVSAVRGRFDGFIAAFQSASGNHLVAERFGEITDSPSAIVCALRELSDKTICVPASTVSYACGRLYEWVASMSALPDIVEGDQSPGIRESVLRCIAGLAQSARAHDRARIAMLASKARERLRANLTHHDESILRDHLLAYTPNAEWIGKILELLPASPRQHVEMTPRIHAMIISYKEMRCRVQRNADVVQAVAV
jgi:hypothetical protein